MSVFALCFEAQKCQAGTSFSPPMPAQRVKAIGSTKELPPELSRVFKETSLFKAIARPGPIDWLRSHPEPGQSYKQFSGSNPNRIAGERNKLYLMPVGKFPKPSPSLSKLREFASIYFGSEVRMLPDLDLKKARLHSRKSKLTGKKQFLCDDILYESSTRLPGDGFALLSLTMTDLYPSPSWNYVFGMASLEERVGVFSFARYSPAFYGIDDMGSEERRRLILLRSMKVLAHEMAHMYGIKHCIYYNCVMNGSNHLKETDEQSLFLCPVDLRKLYSTAKFNPLVRYGRLRDFMKREGFVQETRWLDKRIGELQTVKSGFLPCSEA